MIGNTLLAVVETDRAIVTLYLNFAIPLTAYVMIFVSFVTTVLLLLSTADSGRRA
jgi:hypothetical protein